MCHELLNICINLSCLVFKHLDWPLKRSVSSIPQAAGCVPIEPLRGATAAVGTLVLATSTLVLVLAIVLALALALVLVLATSTLVLAFALALRDQVRLFRFALALRMV